MPVNESTAKGWRYTATCYTPGKWRHLWPCRTYALTAVAPAAASAEAWALLDRPRLTVTGRRVLRACLDHPTAGLSGHAAPALAALRRMGLLDPETGRVTTLALRLFAHDLTTPGMEPAHPT